MLSAGSLRIETFEGSRARLGPTRAHIGIFIDNTQEVNKKKALV
jgi:hypothetical protein